MEGGILADFGGPSLRSHMAEEDKLGREGAGKNRAKLKQIANYPEGVR